ncbi:MAG: lytic murein transglycosylase [Shimia sp.]
MRLLALLLLCPTLALATPPEPRIDPVSPEIRAQSQEQRFQAWVQRFKGRAAQRGIRPDVLDAAFRGVRYNAWVVERDRNQSEFSKTLWAYLAVAVSQERIEIGARELRRRARLFDRIERAYGVDKEVVAAVWGLESSYGAIKGDINVIEAMATLAYDGRRGKFFEDQLMAALRILQSGDTRPDRMTGSWAGAMGHTQFMPTSYQAYAVDATGDGRRDIWGDDPTDALASTAAYLKRFGWVRGQPWGVEVVVPRGFDYGQARRSIERAPSDWARLGVVGTDGRAVPNYGAASLLLPAGANGAAFLIFDNFAVLERYNSADAYVIAVGHLADRFKGAGPFQGIWPEGERALTTRERREMQRLLTRVGIPTEVDGKIGPLTIESVRRYQRARGLTPDGFPTVALLRRLRAE